MAENKNFTKQPQNSVGDKPEREVKEEEKPPILGSWRNLYAVVIGFLVLQIIIFYFLTQYLQ